MSKTNKVVLTVALCGNGTTKAMTPYVPEQPDELAADIVACAKAGAAVAHLHFRDKNGKATMNTEIVKEVCDKAREACAKAGVDICLNLTTSGSRFTWEERIGHLRACMPEMCTFDPCTMNWGNSFVFLNEPKFLEKLGKEAIELGIKPELEIFDCGHLHNLSYFVKNGILKAPLHLQFMLGVTGAMPGNVESLGYMLPFIPEGATWSISGIGKAHMPMMLAGLAAGCDGLRVGLEDNLYLSHGVRATNVQLVERAAKLVELSGREVATAAEAREILGLTKHVDF